MGKTHCQQFMMEVVLVGHKGKAPFPQALAHHPKCIEHGKAEEKQPQRRCIGSAKGVGQHDGGDGQIKTKKLAAGIAINTLAG